MLSELEYVDATMLLLSEREGVAMLDEMNVVPTDLTVLDEGSVLVT